MGTIYQLDCPKCNYHKELFLGAGIMACNPKAVISEFSSELASAFYTALENNTLTHFNFSRELGFCTTCHDYFATPVLHYETSSKNSSTLLGSCHNYRNPLTVIDPKSITCPKCREPLSLKTCGHWD